MIETISYVNYTPTIQKTGEELILFKEFTNMQCLI